ncbi:hypothetical protein ACHWQZ_G012070 [Mnemiopsis leidyi]
MSDFADQQVVKTGVQYSNRVFVGNLHTRMSEYDVCWIMRRYGFHPEDVKVIRDVNGCSKGYCFVDFRSESEAKRLLSHENIASKFGRKLLIKPAIRIQRKEVLVIKQQPTASYSPEITAPVKPETQARSENSYTPASTVPVATVSNPGVSSSRGPSLLSQRGVNKLSLNLNLEGVTEASQGPCNLQYSPVTYLVPSQPGTPVLHQPGTPVLHPDYHQLQVPHGQQVSSPFSELQYHIPSLPSTPFSDLVSPYSPTFAQGMQSPVYGFPSGTAFSYGRGMPLPFYQPFYQNSYFSSTLRSPTRPRFSAAPTPASPNVQTSPAGPAGTSLPVVCKPDQFSPDHHADDLASKIRSLNI